MASTYLTKTLGTPTNNKKFTFSCWVKKSGTSGTMDIFHAGADGPNEAIMCRFESNGQLTLKHDVGGTQEMLKQSTALYRDPNAWYHIVTVFDTDNATAEDRQRIYVNGERITDWASSDNFSQGDDVLANKAVSHTIGKRNFDSANYLDGVLSHVHFCDGQAYDASYFGSTDATTGEWKINTSPSVTYGNNGFFILKDGNSVTDQSGNSNNWTVSGGTLTKTEDCPSNVFCTLNPLSTDSGVTLSSGNTESDYDGSVGNAKGTLGFSSGKFYWEVKIATAASNYPMLGIGSLDAAQMQKTTGGSYPGGFTNSYGAYGNGNVYANSSNTGSQSFTWATNDIIGIAVDLDSGTKTIKWYKNGSQIATYNITTDGPFASMDYNGGEAAVNLQYNFGNGYFGTTAVSSAGTNASNNGIFEYDVPAGYTALSTKGLNL